MSELTDKTNESTQTVEMTDYSGDYPVADPPEYGDSDYKSRGGKIISGTPDLFMSLVREEIDIEDEDTLDNIDDLANMMSNHMEIDPPTLYVDKNQVVDHDGRHRSEAARKLGYEDMPILIIDVNSLNVEGLDHLKKEDPSQHPRNKEFSIEKTDPQLPLIDINEPDKGHFNSVRQVIATVSRLEQENKDREEILSSDFKLNAKSEDVGMEPSELRELIETNYDTNKPNIERLNEFLSTDDAKELFKSEKEKASSITFGSDLSP